MALDVMNSSETSVTQRVRIEYFDQDEAFSPFLPRSGALVRQYGDVHGNRDWFLMELDEPLEYQYQLTIGEPNSSGSFTSTTFSFVHVGWGTRWVLTSVFVLLVDQATGEVADPFDPASYVHVAWGMCVSEA